MKKLYTLLFLILIVTSAHAQNPVPNPDMEIWSGTPTSPDSWLSYNSPGFTPITKVAGHTGFAAQGNVVNYMGMLAAPTLTAGALGTFSYTNWFNSIQFYYKANLVAGDELIVSHLLLDAGSNLIAVGIHTISSSASGFTFGAMSIDSIQTGTPPYSSQLYFTITSPNPDPSINSSFVLDDIEFSTAIISGTNEISSQKIIADIFPDPAKDFVTIRLNDDKQSIEKIVLQNMLGQVVSSSDGSLFNNREATLDVRHLKAGVYFVQLIANGKNNTFKFVKRD